MINRQRAVRRDMSVYTTSGSAVGNLATSIVGIAENNITASSEISILSQLDTTTKSSPDLRGSFGITIFLYIIITCKL